MEEPHSRELCPLHHDEPTGSRLNILDLTAAIMRQHPDLFLDTALMDREVQRMVTLCPHDIGDEPGQHERRAFRYGECGQASQEKKLCKMFCF